MNYFKVSELQKIQKDDLFGYIPDMKDVFYRTLLKKSIEPSVSEFLYVPWAMRDVADPIIFTSLENTIEENLNMSLLLSHNIKWLDTFIWGTSFDNEMLIGVQDRDVNDKKKRVSEPEFGKAKTLVGTIDDDSETGIVFMSLFNNESEEMKFLIFEYGNQRAFRLKNITTDIMTSQKVKKLQKEKKYDNIWNEM